jgi:hypothetical protein
MGKPRRGRKRHQAGGRKAANRRESAQAITLDRELQELIRQEAQQLRLSETEYLRLVVNVSETLRNQFFPTGLPEGGWLKVLIGNPLLMGMMKNWIGQMMEGFGKQSNQVEQPGGTGRVNQPGLGPGGPTPNYGGQRLPGYGMMPGPYATPAPQVSPKREEENPIDGLMKMMTEWFGSKQQG